MKQKIITVAIIAVILSLFLSGCEQPVIITDESGSTPAGVLDVVKANNQFAFDLYSEFKDKEENIFFSPYSISTALAMTYEGARGKTAEEMQSVLHFPESNILRPNCAAIYNNINKKDKKYKLSTANALWAQKDYLFLDQYTNTIEKYYGGKVTNLDFVGESEKSRKIINDWVEDQTNDKIKDLIPQGVLNELTRLVLTNAIYFKGDWVLKFDKKKTMDAPFKITPEKTVQVKMMGLTGKKAKFNYAFIPENELQIIELPYDGEELSMLILLPKEGGLSSLEELFTEDKLNEWKNQMGETKIDVYLPRFKFETKYFMKDNLKVMGMPTAFKLPEADFSGMDGTKELKIDEVIHQAFVEVNEEGTEAAAATAVIMVMTSMPNIFRADHPFIFVIQQKDTGNILFLGRVSDPSKF